MSSNLLRSDGRLWLSPVAYAYGHWGRRARPLRLSAMDGLRCTSPLFVIIYPYHSLIVSFALVALKSDCALLPSPYLHFLSALSSRERTK